MFMQIKLFTKIANYQVCLPQEAAILGAISFFVGWVVLAFFSSILLDIVDATYLCYAIDKDTQTITKPEVHEIYSKVSTSFLD